MKNCKNLGVSAHLRLNDKKELKDNMGELCKFYPYSFSCSQSYTCTNIINYILKAKGCRYNPLVKMCRPLHNAQALTTCGAFSQ